MRAIRQYAFGPAENLLFEQVEDPKAATGQVRMVVRAAGVHLLDTNIRRGMRGGPFPPPELPMTPGREVAGVVDQLGPDVDPAWLGRRAIAHLGLASGGYAELALAPVGALHEIPDGMSDEVAVATIGTGRTAAGILELAAVSVSDVVLVPAAAGGIGSLLVQAAVNAGAVVVGAAGGPSKVDSVRRLGATVAVDYATPDWVEAVRESLGDRKVSLVLDGVGGEVGKAAFELAGVGGRIVFFGWSAGEPVQVTTADLYARGLTVSVAVGPRMLQRPGGLRGLERRALADAAAGRLVPLIHPPFPLSDAAAAHTALESRKTTGKVVLRPKSPLLAAR